MKTTLLLLSAACCLTLPAVVRADSFGSTSTRTAVSVAKANAASRAAAPGQVIVYITDRPLTGSNIPMTYRQYNGRINPTNAAVYSQNSLRFTGSTDVATALYKLEPSITLSRGR